MRPHPEEIRRLPLLWVRAFVAVALVESVVLPDAHPALYELSIGGVGNAVALYFQRLKMTGVRPIQSNVGGLNRVKVTWEAITNSVTTTDRSLSPWILAMG